MTQRVLITGGAVRLGAAFCQAFADAGWEVICHHNRSAEAAQALQRAIGPRLHLIQAELGDEPQRQRLMAEVHERFGPLQALVNNASLFEPDSGTDFNPEVARRQLEVNLLAPLSLSRWLVRHWRDAGTDGQPPCIVHVLDQKVFNLNPDYFSYTVSKLALERAVALQAQALAPHARVCGIAPGLMFESGPQSSENFQSAGRVNLLRRPIDPMDVARTAVFLAGNPAITGATVAVDNGQHLVPLERDVMFVVDDLMKRQELP